MPHLMVVANRLPFRRLTPSDSATTTPFSTSSSERDTDSGPETNFDDQEWVSSPGGLVAALSPALADISTTWVGWPGDVDTRGPNTAVVDDMQLVIVQLDEEEKRLHYNGMSNGTLWPLFHDKVAPVEIHRSWFEGYRRVNQRFADRICEVAPPNSAVWVHDYQLMLVPAMIRQHRPDLRLGFFLHTPFPPAELFMQLPWRNQLIAGVLGSDLVGFQVREHVNNFARVAQQLELATSSKRPNLTHNGREVQLKAFPIGTHFSRYDEAARTPQVTELARDLRARLGQPHTVLLGVDRLDYTKGIDVRLRAFRELLDDGRIHPSQVAMVQVAEPSRDDVEAYVSLRSLVQQLVGEIMGDFSRLGFPVIHYLHQTHSFEELLGLYRAADVMLVTPFRDGMNLVAKEYVSTRYDDTGFLILSEFAGAATQLKQANLINPYDIKAVKAAIEHAVHASPLDAHGPMRAMRRTVKKHDAVAWAQSFLDAMF